MPNLITALFAATALVYALAWALYLVVLFRGSGGVGRFAHRALAVAVPLHVAFLVADFVIAGHSPLDHIQGTLAVLALGVIVAFLVATMRHDVAVLGAFVTPVTLLFFLASSLGRSVGPVPAGVRTLLLPLHVGVNILGVAAFAFAFATSVAYVLQEQLLRRKHVEGPSEQLPSLEMLDSLGFRAILVGFPLLTVGVLTGAAWAYRESPAGTIVLGITQGFGLLAWLIFATVLLLRVAWGWRGRRAAIGTILGFGCAVAVLAGYVVQASGGAS
ncbi:MAG: cytochrome c biogenesis protein CcsA [Myxococcales bacterium]|nr:cytochrome c biogenesis protein CcsA [Myxococcales bacterium]